MSEICQNNTENYSEKFSAEKLKHFETLVSGGSIQRYILMDHSVLMYALWIQASCVMYCLYARVPPGLCNAHYDDMYHVLAVCYSPSCVM